MPTNDGSGGSPGRGRPKRIEGEVVNVMVRLPVGVAGELRERAERDGKKLAELCRDVLGRESRRKPRRNS